MGWKYCISMHVHTKPGSGTSGSAKHYQQMRLPHQHAWHQTIDPSPTARTALARTYSAPNLTTAAPGLPRALNNPPPLRPVSTLASTHQNYAIAILSNSWLPRQNFFFSLSSHCDRHRSALQSSRRRDLQLVSFLLFLSFRPPSSQRLA